MSTRAVRTALLALAVVAAGCARASPAASSVPELDPVDPNQVTALLETSDRPVVLNVWASWCIPCRSEAPLLRQASGRFGNEVRFVGINVRDGQDGARSFIAEFFPTSAIDHFWDRPGNVPVALGGTRGVPITFFFAPGGELVFLHNGVIDERTLALQIDELLAR